MLPASLIVKKRDGGCLRREEIHFLVEGFVQDEVTDYQMAALAMAICIRGMNAEETAALTDAMFRSGRALPRPAEGPHRLDKHSTGGLGDKVSLVLAPLLAACDVHVPMISGRGLGITGGTLDKLESISGFSSQCQVHEAARLLEPAGCFIVGASLQIAPADRRLYAIRDVTGTVESVALITASILSKKLAASLDALVMDIKVGNGAFMKTADNARELAEALVVTGDRAGLPVQALLTDMDQPLGRAIGNAIEVNEALDVLEGGGPPEVRELVLALASRALQMVGPAEHDSSALDQLAQRLDDGSARERFERMVAAQGGSLGDRLALHPGKPVFPAAAGYLQRVDCQILGESIVAMGGGRTKVGDGIDHRVGIQVNARIGDRVTPDEPLAVVHCPSQSVCDQAEAVPRAFHISPDPVPAQPLIHGSITLDDCKLATP